jgi:rRNA N6-adenosine-methyltransferase METTL5
MRLRELESALGQVSAFRAPVAELEQYPTSPHLAARMLHVAASNGDIGGRAVLDLGCGGGILAIGAALLGAPHVVGVDVDEAALHVAAENAEEMDAGGVLDLVRADVVRLSAAAGGGLLGEVDTVVMNPPFGTKRRGMDVCFLQIAVQHARGAVYSLHKSSTRPFIQQKALSWGVPSRVLAQLQFDIPAMYDFHRQSSLDVEVDLWRLDCGERVLRPLPDPATYVAARASVPCKSHGSRGRARRKGGGRPGGRGGTSRR